jgi:hypothetical protein
MLQATCRHALVQSDHTRARAQLLKASLTKYVHEQAY